MRFSRCVRNVLTIRTFDVVEKLEACVIFRRTKLMTRALATMTPRHSPLYSGVKINQPDKVVSYGLKLGELDVA